MRRFGISAVAIGVRQQRQETCPLDGGGQLALILGLGAGNTAGDNFSGLADKRLQQVEILVIDLGNAFGGKAAVSSTTKIT